MTPLAGATLVCPNNTVVTATFSAAMQPATVAFTLAGPGTTPVPGVVTYDSTNTIFTFTPSSPPLALSTTYTAAIAAGAIDEYGIALASPVVWSFTTSSELCAPPTVLSVTPGNGACPSTAVTATFSEAMNPATIISPATTFTLQGPGTTPVTGVVTYALSTATFTPNAALTVGTTYTATITTGAQDLNGDALASNKVWTFTTAANPCAPPTVVSVAPLVSALDVCPSTLIVATFSEAMNPATITNTTFTLAVSPSTPVAGTVTYDVSSYAATFTPNVALTVGTTYTATITTGAQDLGGIGLATDYMWTFTTAAAACTAPPTVPMGKACGFGALAATPVLSSISDTVVTGEVGIYPAASITGFALTGGPGIAASYDVGDAAAMQAQAALATAYAYAAAAPGGATLPADVGGETLAPGVYKTTSAQPSLGITGNLTLAAGTAGANGVWIFQIVSTLTTAAGNSQVILTGGGLPQNVFWQVGSSATLGTNTLFAGTIMSEASTTVTTGATLDGRAMALTGAVTLDDNQVNVPPCP